MERVAVRPDAYDSTSQRGNFRWASQGQRLMARGFDRQVAELEVRIAVLNGYTALGIPVDLPRDFSSTLD